MTTVHDFTVEKPDGTSVTLNEYANKILIIVNTATKCGLAPQFKELERLYQTYKEEGVAVLGFPSNQFMNQEPVEDDKMEETCELNFGVTFPLFKKIHVNGQDAHPLYKYLKEQEKGLVSQNIKWNFTKFLVDGNGKVIKRYSPQTAPKKIEADLKQLI